MPIRARIDFSNFSNDARTMIATKMTIVDKHIRSKPSHLF